MSGPNVAPLTPSPLAGEGWGEGGVKQKLLSLLYFAASVPLNSVRR
jgi:hypothetical protein